jgi:hypothetical protein
MLKLNWSARCLVCHRDLPAGTYARWDRRSATATCPACAGTPAHPLATATARPKPRELERGRAGVSAQREYLRRRRAREARIRRRHPLIGWALIALRAEPQHETAFRRGALGEQGVARSLERRTRGGPAVILHDRRMPTGRGNIDHLAVARRGVYVIDAKAIHGSVRVRRRLFGEAKLLVDGRDRAKLVQGLERQIAAVGRALAQTAYADLTLHGVFCFTEAELPLLLGREIRGCRLCSPRAVARALNAKGPLGEDAIAAIARELDVAFPAA